MAFDMTILASGNSAENIFYVAIVLFFVIGGTIMEKMKQKAAEAERQRRPSIPPPVRPPVPPQMEGRGRSFPPPVAPPPWSRPVPPVVRPPQPAQRRPVERVQPPPQRPRQVKPPRVPQVRPEANRPIEAASSLRPALAPSGVERAVAEIEREADRTTRGPAGSLQPAQSLAQIRAQQAQAGAGFDPATLRRPTIPELRRAIVLNEILGPPIALREGE